jgi:hypothetical protein
MVAWVPPASRNEEIGREMFISVGQSRPATDIYYDAAGVRGQVRGPMGSIRTNAATMPKTRSMRMLPRMPARLPQCRVLSAFLDV